MTFYAEFRGGAWDQKIIEVSKFADQIVVTIPEQMVAGAVEPNSEPTELKLGRQIYRMSLSPVYVDRDGDEFAYYTL